ncbi:MAG TPA: hypothetical protein VHU91_08725, partial [Mycobacteriales bacterium]|nr:hypothetical protein [Mycobacteriales bacterium]
GDSWARAIRHREALLASWKLDLETGVTAVGTGSAAGKRLAESVGLLNFLERETADMMRRWEERRPNRASGGKA